MKQVIQRLFEPTPPFFERIRNIAMIVAAMAIFFIWLQSNFEFPEWKQFRFPKWINEQMNYKTVILGFEIVFLSQLTSVYRDRFGNIDPALKEEYEKSKLKE